jgi:CSLREA domain-containing protein
MLMLGLVLALAPARQVALAAMVTVNSTTDISDGDTSSIANLIADPGPDGVISLREAIEAANNTPGADTIAFSISGCGGVCSIQPLSALPSLSGGGTTIDGYTQPGAAPATEENLATLLIEINGASAGACHGFHITSAGNEIKGLVINRFTGYWYSIFIDGSEATNNTISGNYVGTDASGTVDLGNPSTAVYIAYGASNIIGGDSAAERNVISGNGSYGVRILYSDATGNTVSGNYIGTDSSGAARLGNDLEGIRIEAGAHDNVIGGNTPGHRNVISGNGQNGIWIDGSQYSSTTGNIVSGNYIGTDASGTVGLGNEGDGVQISGGSHGNIVGGDTDGERNIISGNDDRGIYIYGDSDVSATGNAVYGNYIGTDATGTAVLGNGGSGICIGKYTANNFVGGNTPGERNVISGNTQWGVEIKDSSATYTTVSGNYIGTDASGMTDLGNDYSGVFIHVGAHDNTIGGDTAGERNTISGNDHHGVFIHDSDSNTVCGNYIGTDASGTASLGNSWHGVGVGLGAQDNLVGPGNVVAYNGWDGVGVDGSTTVAIVITQNSIYANSGMGIDLTDSANGGIAAPVIITTTNTGPINIKGTACPGCTVEVFENRRADGEGETYVGSSTANASGDFDVTVSSLSKPHLTATATDPLSGTSEFASVFSTVEVTYVYVPIVMRND